MRHNNGVDLYSGCFSHAEAMLAAYFTRTTIATVLLVAGIRWLARRVSETKQLPWCPFYPLLIPQELVLPPVPLTPTSF